MADISRVSWRYDANALSICPERDYEKLECIPCALFTVGSL